MNQCEQVLAHLRQGPLTPLDALRRYGVMRLAARVLDLRQRGHQIHAIPVETQHGKRVARYVLVREARNVG